MLSLLLKLVHVKHDDDVHVEQYNEHYTHKDEVSFK
jgi:hypothetical protein